MPRLYPHGSFSDTATILSLGLNGKSLALTGAPPNFRLKVGDRFSYLLSGYHFIHEVQEEVSANASGVTPEFDVFPHLPLPLVTSTAVRLKRPVVSMRIEPESIAYNGAENLIGTVSFSAVQLA
jgi:hypothetical protein